MRVSSYVGKDHRITKGAAVCPQRGHLQVAQRLIVGVDICKYINSQLPSVSSRSFKWISGERNGEQLERLSIPSWKEVQCHIAPRLGK